MYRPTLALLAVFALSSAVFAQTANPYNGTWTVLLEGFERAKLEGTAVVKDEVGTWHITARDRLDNCIGREAPIAVQVASAEGLVFKVNRSQVLAGCPDFTMKFKKIDDKTMKAQLTGGRSATLTRN